jgi:thiamine transport system permease protein
MKGSRLLTIPALVIGLGFFVWPMLSILSTALGEHPGRAISIFGEYGLRSVVWFTVWQALASTAAALAIGVPAAYALARFEFRGRAALRTLLTIPFVLPTVVVAVAFLALIGPQGTLGIDLAGTAWAIIAAHVFFNLAVVIRTVGSLWSHLDPALEGAAATLGASRWRAFRTVTLPLLRPAMSAAAAIVFLFSFTSFGVVLLLGAPRLATLEVEIYRNAALVFDLPTAAALALVQLIGVTAALFVYSGRQARAATPQPLVAGTAARRRPLGRDRWWILAALTPALTLVVLPLGAILVRTLAPGGSLGFGAIRALAAVDPAVADPLGAIGNSLAYGVVACVIALVVGLPAATFIAGRRSGSSRWLDTLIMLPIASSAVTLGFGFVIALDAPVDLRTWWLLVPIAHALIAIPFVVRLTVPVARSIASHLREAGATLGASPRRVWRTVDLPMLTPAAAGAAALAFVISLGEFGATLFIARPGGQTMTLAIFRLLGPGNASRSAALALALILIGITAAVVALLERMRAPGVGEF